MPFERRSDVQVLEDDGSEMLLQRNAANRTFFGQNKLKKQAAKPVQNTHREEKEKRRALLVFRDLLRCLDRFPGRLRLEASASPIPSPASKRGQSDPLSVRFAIYSAFASAIKT